MRTGTANLPLHSGKCPPWLFQRMKELSAAIVRVIVEEFGVQEVLRRLADPVWFQTLGCVLGFDWHSSGVTTTVCGALKEGLKPYQGELGLFFAGGKGGTSRKTPLEIVSAGEKFGLGSELQKLPDISRLTAKIDSAAVQDGYELYHHFFIFTAGGEWAVVQQGMNKANRYARRYHWLEDRVGDFLHDPHAGVCCNDTGNVLNMVASEGNKSRTTSLYLAKEAPQEVSKVIAKLGEKNEKTPLQPTLFDEPTLPEFTLPSYHPVPRVNRIEKQLKQLYDRQPEDYLTLLAQPGIGPATVRALAMVAEVAYGTPPSMRDPVRYSFAHGGKDGYPFPVNRKDYDTSIETLRTCLESARLGNKEKLEALKRLTSLEKVASGAIRDQALPVSRNDI